MKNKIKQLKTLSLSPNDIIIVTVPWAASPDDWEHLKEALTKIVDNNCLLVPQGYKVRKELPTDGKHKVYLNNLEFIEYLHNKKGS